MSAPPDPLRASWRLKIARAKKHFDELQNEIRIYSERRPYEVRWERQREGKDRKWLWVLRFTERPGSDFGIIIGDIIHNLRSALDHLAVALAPPDRQSQAGFPIVREDIWACDAAGRYLSKNDDARQRFEQAVRGMPDEAITIIKQLQPHADWPGDPSAFRLWLCYPDGEQKVFADRPEIHDLDILSRFDNADKHRGLIDPVAGIKQAVLTYPDTTGRYVQRAIGPVNDGAIISRVIIAPKDFGKPHPKVYVEVDEPLHVLVDIGAPEGLADAVDVLAGLIVKIPRIIFVALEPLIDR